MSRAVAARGGGGCLLLLDGHFRMSWPLSKVLFSTLVSLVLLKRVVEVVLNVESSVAAAVAGCLLLLRNYY